MNTATWWLAIPELTNTEPLPWWGYAAISLLFLVGGGVVRLELLHYRAVQTGKLLPRITVDLLMAAKDKEIERLQREVERWNAAYHITQQALVESMEAVEENTDALRALAPVPASPRHTDPPTRTSMNAEATNARRNRERG